MSRVSSATVFDSEQFVADVIAYTKRWRINHKQLIITACLDESSTRAVLRGEQPLTLYVACKLADICDLSLDKYRRLL